MRNRPRFLSFVAVRVGVSVAGVLLCAGASLASATVLFTEDFENGSGLGDGKWATIGNAVLASPGSSGTYGVGFTAKASAGDLWSQDISVSGKTQYWISVDYKETGAGGYLGVEEFNNGGHDSGGTWIWGDSSSASQAVFDQPGTGWHHYVQTFTTGASTRSIQLKLEDSSGNAGPLGHVFFDNLSISDTSPTVSVTIVRWEEVVN